MEMDAPAGCPPAVCVVGFKDSGKTGVAVRLVAELRRRGHRVGAVKHGHGFRLDAPGTDSWRLRHEGGADPVLLSGPEGFAFMGGWGPEGELGLEDLLRRHFRDEDVVVVEGFKREPFPRVEVHRGATGAELVYRPGAPDAGLFLALVTDEPRPRPLQGPEGGPAAPPLPVLRLDDPDLASVLADLVEAAVLNRARHVGPGP